MREEEVFDERNIESWRKERGKCVRWGGKNRRNRIKANLEKWTKNTSGTRKNRRKEEKGNMQKKKRLKRWKLRYKCTKYQRWKGRNNYFFEILRITNWKKKNGFVNDEVEYLKKKTGR